MILFSCKKQDLSNYVGTYSNPDKIILQLKIDAQYELENPLTSMRLEGTYSVKGNRLYLKIKKEEYNPYKIEVVPQTKSKSGYEFVIKGKEWKELSNANCQIQQNGNLIKELYTNDSGKINFEPTSSSKLIIKYPFWETVEIDLDELAPQSYIVTIEREKFKENLKKLEFEIKESNLLGIEEIKHWVLQKELK